jgi:Nucleotidyltransferase domain
MEKCSNSPDLLGRVPTNVNALAGQLLRRETRRDMRHIAVRLAQLPGVLAVTLGGSRAQGTERPDSDWDFGLYYEDTIDPADVEALGWPGEITGPGGWGPVVNGGAWLVIDGQRVDLCYRNVNEVEYAVAEAEQGRFQIWNLPNYVGGIPSYVLVGELSLCEVLYGQLPRPEFPHRLAERAPVVWRQQSSMTVHTAEVHAQRSDFVATVANMSRAIIMEAQARLVERGIWALNEKGIFEKAGLSEAAQLLPDFGSTAPELLSSVEALQSGLSG